MAWYRYGAYLDHKMDAMPAFDTELAPSTPAPFAGIYRCMGCQREIGIAFNHKLPPEDHHQHNPLTQGAIRWKLIVFADHNPK